MKASKRERVYKRDGYACVQCGSADDLTIDHILAVSRGGCNELTNLQTLCSPCNGKKGNRIPEGVTAPKARRNKAMRKLFGLQHHRHCDPNYCFCECPIYLAEHPELARSLGVTA